MKNKIALALMTSCLTVSVVQAETGVSPDPRLASINRQLSTALATWNIKNAYFTELKYGLTYSAPNNNGASYEIIEDRVKYEPVVTRSGMAAALSTPTASSQCTSPIGAVKAANFVTVNSVDEAFKLVQVALNNKVARLDVSFDRNLGYPTRIYIDPNTKTSCDELNVKIENLSYKVLPQTNKQQRQLINSFISNMQKWRVAKTNLATLNYNTKSVVNLNESKRGIASSVSEINTTTPLVQISSSDVFVPSLTLDAQGQPVDNSHKCDAALQANAIMSYTPVMAGDAAYTDMYSAAEKAIRVEDSFTILKAALRDNVDLINVKYDSTLGYPSSLYIDRKTTNICDDISFTLKDFVSTRNANTATVNRGSSTLINLP